MTRQSRLLQWAVDRIRRKVMIIPGYGAASKSLLREMKRKCQTDVPVSVPARPD